MPPRIDRPRGARPSPRHVLAAARPFVPPRALPPAQLARVPAKLSMWGNDVHGDCCSAEEAFAKACYSPEIDYTDASVIAWAQAHGFLEGAFLTPVMDAMASDGLSDGTTLYRDGPYSSVDYSAPATLAAAIAQGPVKIAIDANALPADAGEKSGWHALGTGHFPNTDHCVSLGGYGPAGWLYEQMGINLPSGLSASAAGYLLFTWASLGFVDHDWLMGTCAEAWLRDPTTIGPGPAPVPPPVPVPIPPAPPGPPGPTPLAPAYQISLTGAVQTPLGTFPLTLSGDATPAMPGRAALLPDLLKLLADVKAHAAPAVILADLAKLAGDFAG